MALGILFLSEIDDHATVRPLHPEARGGRCGKPAGRLYHASFLPAGKVAVFDVWDSQALVRTFGGT